MDQTQQFELSVVVPVYNEEDSVQQLYEEIVEAVCGTESYEVIFVDDGSTDKSLSLLESIQRDDSRVRVIRFRGNFGQTAALSAGIEHSRGRIIVPLDADGQNDPGDIPKLIEKLEEGYDIVRAGEKTGRIHFLPAGCLL